MLYLLEKYYNFFAVGIHDNFIVVIYNLGSGVTVLKSHETLSESRTWHYLVTGHSRQHVYIYIDSQPKALSTSFGAFSSLDVSTALFIGGVPFNFTLPEIVANFFSSGYMGAIYQPSLRTSNLYFTPLLYTISIQNLTDTSYIQLESSLGIITKAESCENQFCSNNGLCVDQGVNKKVLYLYIKFF